MEWIRVTDSLPSQKGVFLVYTAESYNDFHGFFVVFWCGEHFNDWPPNCGCTGISTITHWMPLPNPPGVK